MTNCCLDKMNQCGPPPEVFVHKSPSCSLATPFLQWIFWYYANGSIYEAKNFLLFKWYFSLICHDKQGTFWRNYTPYSTSQNKIEDNILYFSCLLSKLFSMECVLSVYLTKNKSRRYVFNFNKDNKWKLLGNLFPDTGTVAHTS